MMRETIIHGYNIINVQVLKRILSIALRLCRSIQESEACESESQLELLYPNDSVNLCPRIALCSQPTLFRNKLTEITAKKLAELLTISFLYFSLELCYSWVQKQAYLPITQNVDTSN